MRYTELDGFQISKIGIGGHYSKTEEGRFEASTAEVTPQEVRARTALMEKAFAAGITYYDSTWQNEAQMLAESIRPLGIRDRVFINGMVLGSFRGSAFGGISPEAYLDRYLDARLRVMPGGYFNSFMINAIEEDYSDAACEKLVNHMERRRKAGDFSVLGFSCHDHALARHVADTFPEFRWIMVAYNYKNRRFEETFEGYTGQAGFVAMKPLIWYEYGVPFCRIHDLPAAEGLIGGKKEDIAADAVAWTHLNPLVSTTVCAVNSQSELDTLLKAGEDGFTPSIEALEGYRRGIEAENHIPFLLGASLCGPENRRSLNFGLKNLAGALGLPYPDFPLNDSESDKELQNRKKAILAAAADKGYGRFLEGISLD